MIKILLSHMILLLNNFIAQEFIKHIFYYLQKLTFFILFHYVTNILSYIFNQKFDQVKSSNKAEFDLILHNNNIIYFQLIMNKEQINKKLSPNRNGLNLSNESPNKQIFKKNSNKDKKADKNIALPIPGFQQFQSQSNSTITENATLIQNLDKLDVQTPTLTSFTLKFQKKKLQEVIKLSQYNFVCPLCGNFITPDNSCLYDDQYKDKYNRKFTCHIKCIMEIDQLKYKLYPLLNLEDARIKNMSSCLSQIPPKPKQINQEDWYTARIQITHPISNFQYFKCQKKIFRNDTLLFWHFIESEPQNFQPNMICIPFSDFKVNLIVQYSKQFKRTYEFLVNLCKAKQVASKKRNAIQVSITDVFIQMEAFKTKQQKVNIIDQMNYKYRYSQQHAMYRFNYIKIQIPDEFLEQEQQMIEKQQQLPLKKPSNNNAIVEPKIEYSNINIMNPINNMNMHPMSYIPYQNFNYCYDYPQTSPIHQSPSHLNNLNRYIDNQFEQTSSHVNNSLRYPQNQYQQSPSHLNNNMNRYVDNSFDYAVYSQSFRQMQQHITNGTLYEYAISSTGSRQLQKYLKKCNQDELSIILNSLYQRLDEIVVDEYGNYMFQSLVNSCKINQRIKIVTRLAPHLPQLVTNKKGTHSLQTLVSLITTDDESRIVCESLQEDLCDLSENQHSSYFIERVIMTFDIKFLGKFNEIIKTNFLRLSNHSNGVRVVKTMIKKMQNKQLEIKSFIGLINTNIDNIIQDPFGNYIVQHAFQVYGEQKCQSIINKILYKFVPYSIQRYSANVIQKCLNLYCKNIETDVTRIIIEGNGVEEMIKSATGSEILQIVVKNFPLPKLIDNIKKVLSYQRGSKYSGQWNSLLNSLKAKANTCKNKSEQQQYNNFSEAHQVGHNTSNTNIEIRKKAGTQTPNRNKIKNKFDLN